MLRVVAETDTHYDIEEYDNEDITIATIKRHLVLKEDFKALFNAINRPLKMEELKVNLKVWDNKVKQYVEINEVRDGRVYFYTIGCSDEYNRKYLDNVYYRYQPLESEN